MIDPAFPARRELSLDRQQLLGQYRAARKEIEEILQTPARKIPPRVGTIEPLLSHARDGLINHLRRHSAGQDLARWRHALEQVNVALSLSLAVEYPVTKIQQNNLHDAACVLQGLIDEWSQPPMG